MNTEITIQDLGRMRDETNIGRMGIESDNWAKFCLLVLGRIQEELDIATESIKANIEPWICLQVKGQQVIVLGSWTAKPDLVVLSNVHKVETLLSIAQVKTLISELEVKLDIYSSFRLIQLQTHRS